MLPPPNVDENQTNIMKTSVFTIMDTFYRDKDLLTDSLNGERKWPLENYYVRELKETSTATKKRRQTKGLMM